jgi:uncharacterized protein (DUF362 family)/Pyruvate/2-oxoacid:ferredoxin oxidoreductase delta subunit
MVKTTESHNPKVSIAKCDTYDRKKVELAVEKALSHLGGISQFVRKGDKVLLKVNLLIGKAPEEAVTTHPAVVKAIIRQVIKAGGKPSVGDSPSASSFHSFETVATLAGIKKVCDELKVPLLELNEPVETKYPEGIVSKSFMLSSKLKGFNVIINMPKLKTHSLTIFTGAVKNLFGTISGGHKAAYHVSAQDSHRFTGMLLDLYDTVKPSLNIMDGVIGMEGNGPSGGNPKKVGVIIAGSNAIAVDAVATTIVGIYDYVPLFKIAKERKLPGAHPSTITVLGETIANVKIPKIAMPEPFSYAMAPKFMKNFVRDNFVKRPVLVESLCIGCASCANICPKKAITMVSHRPEFDYNKCIRCYCCQEVCPQKAIILKGGLFSGFHKKTDKNNKTDKKKQKR